METKKPEKQPPPFENWSDIYLDNETHPNLELSIEKKEFDGRMGEGILRMLYFTRDILVICCRDSSYTGSSIQVWDLWSSDLKKEYGGKSEKRFLQYSEMIKWSGTEVFATRTVIDKENSSNLSYSLIRVSVIPPYKQSGGKISLQIDQYTRIKPISLLKLNNDLIGVLSTRGVDIFSVSIRKIVKMLYIGFDRYYAPFALGSYNTEVYSCLTKWTISKVYPNVLYISQDFNDYRIRMINFQTNEVLHQMVTFNENRATELSVFTNSREEEILVVSSYLTKRKWKVDMKILPRITFYNASDGCSCYKSIIIENNNYSSGVKSTVFLNEKKYLCLATSDGSIHISFLKEGKRFSPISILSEQVLKEEDEEKKKDSDNEKQPHVVLVQKDCSNGEIVLVFSVMRSRTLRFLRISELKSLENNICVDGERFNMNQTKDMRSRISFLRDFFSFESKEEEKVNGKFWMDSEDRIYCSLQLKNSRLEGILRCLL